MSSRRSKVLAAASVGVAVVALPATAAHARSDHHSTGPVVVVSGLNNPRQLSLSEDGPLLIAEAGKGGATQITTPQGPTFVGDTGSISAVWHPSHAHDQTPNRIVTGLMSGAGAPDGSFAVGSDGVSSRGEHGSLYVQETFAPPDQLPAQFASQNGMLLKVRHGNLSGVADISGYEAAHDPDRKGVDSDPYAVLAREHDVLVADAAGNDVLRVDKHGHISVFHVFANVRTGGCATQSDPNPSFPGCNFVPTSLAADEHGNIYVGGLSSETPGAGRVVELSPTGKGFALHTWGGFSSVTGVAVGEHGTLYVSELEAPEANPIDPQVTGVLTKITRSGKRTHMDVPFPAGIALDEHHNVYVSAWSIASETGLAGPTTSGQVWRVRF